MKEYLLGGGVVAAVVALLTFGALQCKQNVEETGVYIVEEGAACANELNQYRVAWGVYALQRDQKLEREALRTATENAKKNRLKHFPGKEIIAYNYDGFDAALDQWNESTVGHHEMLFSEKFHKVGTACVRKGDRYYCCARFE